LPKKESFYYARSNISTHFQLQLNEHAQPIWTEVIFNFEQQFIVLGEKTQSQAMHIRNGIVSYDGRKLFLSITNGSLVEVTELQPLRYEAVLLKFILICTAAISWSIFNEITSI
jgi:hypothetical protein